MKETSVSAPPPALNLHSFYKKYLDSDGIPVVSSAKVPDRALYRVRSIARHMLGRMPQVRDQLITRKVRIAVMAATEVTTDIPEHANLKPPEYWNQRARGLGATIAAPASSCAEENVLCYTDPKYAYRDEDIFIHEFAHTVHLLGIVFANPKFQPRLDAAFASAKEKWAKTYAATDVKEYLAEGVQDWFNINAQAIPADGSHNHVNTRSELKNFDQALHDLIAEYFPLDENKCTCH